MSESSRADARGTRRYDTLDRLRMGASRGNTYSKGQPLDAVTASGSSYSASYDAAGNMTCRAPTNASTCTGTPTGAQLTYDNQGQLIGWQNAPSSPTTDAFAYDGSGQRVEQQVTSGGSTTTTTVYVGALADYSTTAGVTSHVNHYTFGGRLVAQRDTALHYTLLDQLGSPVLQVSASGAAEAATLRSPYGTSRYGASDLFGYGLTGQRQDDTTGLDYYNARYYDPVAGQFTSADAATSTGLNRYTYVGGNPETLADPTGHRQCLADGNGGCQNSGGQTGIQKGQPGGGVLTSARDGELIFQIDSTFHDGRTQLVLITLLRSGTGRKFVEFLLQAGQHFDGDAYISWGSLPQDEYAYTNSAGDITLDPSKLLGSGPLSMAGLVNAAGALVHEGVESYFALQEGYIFQASQHMDYVADWYNGKVTSELNTALHTTDGVAAAYGTWFNKWLGYKQYAKADPSVNTSWWQQLLIPVIWSLSQPGADGVVPYDEPWPNAMGLSTSMLSSNCVEPGACTQ